ncbi:MAG: insulinase family protein [Lactobacillus sp.]|nr:insulinase family protein [Lactobacillus sp.]
MELYSYPQFGESLYTTILDNGLRVNLLPRKDFHKTYGILTTNYGSIDNEFVPLGETNMRRFPDGIAHFLEHKLFEKEDHDAFDIFGKYGADANAFTSFTRTSYLFSTTRNADKCVEALLDFVQTPYFSEKTVAKEKGIIGQEIKMYDDDPNWQLYFGIIGNLYPKNALSSDIAGTVESIEKITSADLYACYHTFYQPSNMNLFLVGNFEVEEMIDLIKKNQAKRTFPQAQPIERADLFFDPQGKEIIPYRMTELAVQRPKTIIGIKGLDILPGGRESLSYKLKIELLLYLLYGEASERYQELYDQGVLDDSFSYDFSLERGFHFASISGDTNKPQELSNAVIEIAEHALETLEGKEVEFELAKKEMIGRNIQALNSLESIANSYEGDLFEGATLFDVVPLLEELTLRDIKEVAQQFLRSEAISVYQILPKEDDLS